MTSDKEVIRIYEKATGLLGQGIGNYEVKLIQEAIRTTEQKARQGVLEEVRRKIEGAYHDRNDYPPFEIVSFHDRPKYHRYILMLIAELKTKTEVVKYE